MKQSKRDHEIPESIVKDLEKRSKRELLMIIYSFLCMSLRWLGSSGLKRKYEAIKKGWK